MDEINQLKNYNLFFKEILKEKSIVFQGSRPVKFDFMHNFRIESIIDNHQTIITTTDLGHLDCHLLESFMVVEIEKIKN